MQIYCNVLQLLFCRGIFLCDCTNLATHSGVVKTNIADHDSQTGLGSVTECVANWNIV